MDREEYEFAQRVIEEQQRAAAMPVSAPVPLKPLAREKCKPWTVTVSGLGVKKIEFVSGQGKHPFVAVAHLKIEFS